LRCAFVVLAPSSVEMASVASQSRTVILLLGPPLIIAWALALASRTRASSHSCSWASLGAASAS
jgi:hypothetical protein